jgi:hypothetical protein
MKRQRERERRKKERNKGRTQNTFKRGRARFDGPRGGSRAEKDLDRCISSS